MLSILSIVSKYSLGGASRITNSCWLKHVFPERFLATKTQQHLPVSGGAFFFVRDFSLVDWVMIPQKVVTK